MDTAAIDEFVTITQATKKVAKQFLTAFGGDTSAAVQAFFEDPEQLADDAPGPQDDDIPVDLDEDFIPEAEEFVRAPMQQVRQRLVADDLPQAGRGRRTRKNQPVEAFRDLQAEQGVIFGGRAVNKKATPLADLFRPPLELLFRGSLEKAAKQAASTKRWLLINVQDAGVFDCQRLNRDTWSDPEIKRIIEGSFVMVQLQTTSDQIEEYTNWHTVKAVPHISILDPETTERLWHQEGFLGAKEVKAAFETFLKEHPFDMDNSAPNQHHTERRSKGAAGKTKSFDEMTEEEQMALVIEESLREQLGSSGSIPAPSTAATPALTAPLKRRPSKMTSSKKGDDDDSDDSDYMPDQDDELEARNAPAPKRKSSSMEDDEDDDYEDESNGESHQKPTRKKTKVAETASEPAPAVVEQKKEEDIDWTDDTPIPDSPPDCTLQIRLPDGTNVVQKFHGVQKLSSVAKFVKERLNGRSSFFLATTFPRRQFGRDELTVITLKEAFPRAVVVVEDS